MAKLFGLKGMSISSGDVDYKVWGLFKDMRIKDSECLSSNTPLAKNIEYACEVVEQASKGRIDFSRDFSLYGYNHQTKVNDSRKRSKEYSKTTFINYDKEEDDGTVYGGVSADVVGYQQSIREEFTEYDKVDMSEALISAIEGIKSISADIEIDYGYSLESLLLNAQEGNSEAIVALRNICAASKKIADYVKAILTSGVALSECF